MGSMLRKAFVFPSFLHIDGLYVKKDPRFCLLP